MLKIDLLNPFVEHNLRRKYLTAKARKSKPAKLKSYIPIVLLPVEADNSCGTPKKAKYYLLQFNK